MIRSFGNKATEDIYNGSNSKDSRKIPHDILRVSIRKLDQINAASELSDLKAPPGNRLEALSGNLKGLHSIRINDQYRITFRWMLDGAYDVSIVDYH